ncbi:MAG TPA: hypothetical protein VGE07_30815 [Herpetosiphonaceae bacterium]
MPTRNAQGERRGRLPAIAGRRLSVALVGLLAFAIVSGQLFFAKSALAALYINPAAITIPESGTASPYPSTIAVSGVTGNITKARVRLNGLSHTFPDDIDVLLVGPTGRAVILMSDAGGSFDLNNVTLTFDDAAATALPDTTQIISGSYRPTNIGPTGDVFGGTAPTGPYSTTLAAFNGTNANGTWRLYVVDDAGPEGGAINGGWTLDLTTADLSVAITDAPDPVNAGSQLTYGITVANNGTDSAANVVLRDTLSPSTTFQSLTAPAGWSCQTPAVGATGSLTCTTALLPTGSVNLNLVVRVNSNTANNATLSNSVQVSSGTPDTNIANNTASTTTTVSTLADLGVTLADAPDPVIAGRPLTYTVTVINNGPSFAVSPSWTDTLPAETTFQSISAPAGWSCTPPPVGSGGAVTCTAATLGLASANFTLVVRVRPETLIGTTINNQVTVATTTVDPTAGNDSASAASTVATLANLAAQLRDAPDPVDAGSLITYTLSITNTGPSFAAAVVVSDTIPVNTSFAALNSPAGWSCTTPPVGSRGLVSCSNSAFGLASASFTLAVKVDPATPTGSTITNRATIQASTNDPATANNQATTTTAVKTSANLAIDVSDEPDPVIAGTPLTYTITVSNNGPSFSINNVLTNTLPVSTTFLALDRPGGWTCSTPQIGAAGNVVCQAPSLGLTSATFTLRVRVDPARATGTVIPNTARIGSGTPDISAANNTDSTTTNVVTLANLSLALSDAPDPVVAGTLLTYTLAFANPGPSFAINTVISDSLPLDTTFASIRAPAGWSCSTPVVGAAGAVSCRANSLGLTSGSITLAVRVNPALALGSTVANQAAISSATPDPAVADNASATTTAVITLANTGVTISDSPDPVIAGGQLLYTITAINAGPSNAATSVLTDTLSDDTTFVSIGAPAGWSCVTPPVGSRGQIVCTTASFALASATFQVRVQVNPDTAPDTVLTNSVELRSETNDPSAANNAATATSRVSTKYFIFTPLIFKQ